MRYKSLRQSDLWEQYLRFLNWDVKTTKSGAKVPIMRTPLGVVTKVQRPHKLNNKILDEIEEVCQKRKCMFVKIEPGYGQDDSILKKRDYVVSRFPLSPPSTLIIDLTKSEEELWSDLSKSGKYSVNRARREGNKVRFFQNPDEIKLGNFYQVAKATAKKGKFYMQPYKDIRAKVDIFKDRSYLAEVFDHEDRLVSAKLFLGSEKTVTFLHGGTTDIGRKGKGGYLLMWESILYLKKQGYDVLDLEGVDDDRFPMFTKDWGGFSHFKEKFGGEILRLPLPYIKYRNPILRFLSKKVQLPL